MVFSSEHSESETYAFASCWLIWIRTPQRFQAEFVTAPWIELVSQFSGLLPQRVLYLIRCGLGIIFYGFQDRQGWRGLGLDWDVHWDQLWRLFQSTIGTSSSQIQDFRCRRGSVFFPHFHQCGRWWLPLTSPWNRPPKKVDKDGRGYLRGWDRRYSTLSFFFIVLFRCARPGNMIDGQTLKDIHNVLLKV